MVTIAVSLGRALAGGVTRHSVVTDAPGATSAKPVPPTATTAVLPSAVSAVRTPVRGRPGSRLVNRTRTSVVVPGAHSTCSAGVIRSAPWPGSAVSSATIRRTTS